MLRDIDTFISGINAYLAVNSPSTAPWTRNDVYALNALKGQFLGQGGGDEARRSQFLGRPPATGSGRQKGKSIFNDLRQFKNPESPTSVDGNFNYGQIPEHAPGSVILDPGSFAADAGGRRDALPERALRAPAPGLQHADDRRRALDHRAPADGRRPADRLLLPRPHLRDRHARAGADWRGATSAPFPGYMLIGRGEDFATTLTSASGDIIDQYAETLCGGSDTKYLYKGKCRPWALRRRHPQRRAGRAS